jgi:hypothetical protein
MKKIGKFFKEHRIFTMLMAIVIVCFVLIMTVLINVFGGIGNDANKYGNRLEGIDQIEITEKKQSDFENNITNNKNIKSVDVTIQGKIVYITMIIEPGVVLEEAEGIALKSLDEFTEEEKAFYDFNFTLKQNASDKSEGFVISGAKNKNGTKLIWNNNTPVEKEDASA